MFYIIAVFLISTLLTPAQTLQAMSDEQFEWCEQLIAEAPNFSRLEKLALSHKVDINQAGIQLLGHNNSVTGAIKHYALIRAAKAERWDIVLMLIFLRANPNVVDSLERTALHLAAEANIPAIANALMASGAHVNVLDCAYISPLRIATTNKNIALIKTLIEFGANIDSNTIDGMDGMTDKKFAQLSGIDLEGLRKATNLYSSNS